MSGWQGRSRDSRGERCTGQELINNPLAFRTTADLDTVAAKLIAEVAPSCGKGCRPELTLAVAEPTGDGSSFVLLFRADGGSTTIADSGSTTIMETAVMLKPFGSGTSGTVNIEAWRTVEGAIDSIAVRTALMVRDGVRRGVAQLDPTAEFGELVQSRPFPG